MIAEKTYWDGLAEGVNALMGLLQQKPRNMRKMFPLHPGGILNAYREGDLSFDEAVKYLNEWGAVKTEVRMLRL